MVDWGVARFVLIDVWHCLPCACGRSAPPKTAEHGVVVVPEAKADPDANEPSVAEAPRTTRAPLACNDNARAADREAARNLFQAAVQDYGSEDYAGAAQKFQHAYELSCAAAVLFNLGTCYERLGDSQSAIDTFELYLESSPAPHNAEDVRRRIDTLRGR